MAALGAKPLLLLLLLACCASAAAAAAAPAGPSSTLFLWRHADAEGGGGAVADDARNLTSKGLRHAARGAAWLLRRLAATAGVNAGDGAGAGAAGGSVRIVASPARRAQQTARALADALAAAAPEVRVRVSGGHAPVAAAAIPAIEVRAAAGLAGGARDVLDLAGWLELAPRANSSSVARAWRRRAWDGGGAAPPARARVTVLVGHAPSLGRAAALALTGSEGQNWLALEKGGLAWLEADAAGEVTLRGLLSHKDMKADR